MKTVHVEALLNPTVEVRGRHAPPRTIGTRVFQSVCIRVGESEEKAAKRAMALLRGKYGAKLHLSPKVARRLDQSLAASSR